MNRRSRFDEDHEPLTPMMASNLSNSNAYLKYNTEKLSLKWIFVSIILLFIVGFGGYFAFFRVVKIDNHGMNRFGNSASDVNRITSEYYVHMDQMLLNLAPSGEKQNFLKILLTLQTTSANEVNIIHGKMPLIADAFQIFLRELRASDFSSTGGTHYIKEELIKRANKITAPVTIVDVLFKELVIN